MTITQPLPFSRCIYGSGQIGTDHNLGFAPKNVGLHFSVETEYSPKPWGIHNAWRFIHGKNWRELLNSCPEIKLIMPHLYLPVFFKPCLPGR